MLQQLLVGAATSRMLRLRGCCDFAQHDGGGVVGWMRCAYPPYVGHCGAWRIGLAEHLGEGFGVEDSIRPGFQLVWAGIFQTLAGGFG